MGKLKIGALLCLWLERNFFDSLAKYLRSVNSFRESIIQFVCPEGLAKKFHDCFGMSNWVLNYWILRSLVNVEFLTTDLDHKM